MSFRFVSENFQALGSINECQEKQTATGMPQKKVSHWFTFTGFVSPA